MLSVVLLALAHLVAPGGPHVSPPATATPPVGQEEACEKDREQATSRGIGYMPRAACTTFQPKP